MKFGLTKAFLIATAIASAGSAAQAQQYYGYASAQSPMPSQQAGMACMPMPGNCQPDRSYGCQVIVCPCPCTTTNVCQNILAQIPPIHPVPTCQEVAPCVIKDEMPPTTTPINIPIYRNCYVPIRIERVPSPTNVTPINIEVRWREVHVLCGPDGKPIAQLTPEMEAMLATLSKPGNATATPATGPATPAGLPQAVAPAPAAPAVPTPTAAAPTTAAPTVADATMPAKTWVLLTSEGVYGYGYQRADGYWIIDPASRRTTPPTAAEMAAQPTVTASR